MKSVPVLVLGLAVACGQEPPARPLIDQRPVIVAIDAPIPAIEGTLLRVTGTRFDFIGPAPYLAVDGGGYGDDLPLERAGGPGELFFRVTPALVAIFGPGFHALEARLHGDSGISDPYPLGLEIATDLSVSLSDVPSGVVHRNDLGVVRGNGLLGEGEGTVYAVFDGTFSPDAGGSIAVSTRIPVTPAERYDRMRGLVRLTTAIGGLATGTFDGTIALESELSSGVRTTSSALSTSLTFIGPELYAFSPTTAYLEQIVSVQGAGFLGGPGEPDEVTLVNIDGTFEPEGGVPRAVFEDLVLEWVSGNEMRTSLAAEPQSGRLVSILFGEDRGVFTGRATVTVIKGTEELSAPPVPFSLTLAGMKQVVWLEFIPGFYVSLSRFGLQGAYGRIEELVRQRVESIYAEWNVDVRLEQPTDFSANGYARIELGGVDPSNRGLFGYDNTPGKDVNNLRLFDRIGGANAENQQDGARGYGGVFVESFLYFSRHPEVSGTPPLGRPDPDPLFDDIFDPVRNRTATLAELSGEGDPARVAAVERALRGLAAMIGETTAHELGHSFGLANPRGSPTTFHNATDDPGCLMDNGSRRSMAERTAEPGAAPSRLCHDAPGYMGEIMPR
jgi:hypothetical protein